MKESGYLVDSSNILERLKKIPILKNFEEHDLKGLLNLSKLKTYDPGEVIIREGDFDNWIYILLTGKVQVVKEGVTIYVSDKMGDVFGEMAIIEASDRSATLDALEETECLAIDASYIYMDRLKGTEKMTFMYILHRIFSELLADRLRVTTEELVAAKKELEKYQGG